MLLSVACFPSNCLYFSTSFPRLFAQLTISLRIARNLVQENNKCLSPVFYCRILFVWLQIHDHMWHICFSLSFAWYFEITANGMCSEAKSFDKATTTWARRPSRLYSITISLSLSSSYSLARYITWIHSMLLLHLLAAAWWKNPINIPYTITL